MRALATALTVTLCLALSARAQVPPTTPPKTVAAMPSAQVTGSIKDTINQATPANIVIMLLRPVDSTLAAFTRTDAQGHFSMTTILPGDYLLWVSHPAFAPYRDSVHVASGKNELGNIFLTLRSEIMKEVIIKGVNPVRLKGDTIEYAADSFAVKPNATVEDLLKRLPGIQVDKNGKITAQGQSVPKVLVDGEEFFSDDPTVATRNLPASAVDKVQVFDKKSDQAAFTGIDDGQTTRTINLKLKKNRKHGYFGRVSAGLGTDGYYENNVALNLFENKRKIAVFGIAANTGRTGMTFSETSNYGTSMISAAGGSGGDGVAFSFSNNNEDFTNWNGSYSDQGVPTAWYGGAHYSNKWDDDKLALNTDYTFNQVKVGVVNNTISQLKLNDSTTNITNDLSKSQITDMQHMLNARYDIQADSLTFIRVTVQGKMRHKDTYTQDSSVITDQTGNLINNTFNETNLSGQNNSFNSTLLVQRKFKKKGRTLQLNAAENYTDVNSSGTQYYLQNGYSGGVLQSADTTDQYKTSYTRNLVVTSQLTYTEPLSANTYLIADYGLDVASGTSDLNAYNRDNTGKYALLDSIYSNFYTVNMLINKGGLFFRKATKKYTYSFGTDAGYTDYHQNNIYQDSLQTRDFLNWYPRASFTYKIGQQTGMGIYYNGNTTQPSLSQLQPVASNANPNNIQIGNPNLRPSYTSQARMYYNHYDMLSERGMNINATYTRTDNAFSSKDSINSYGTQYTQTVNVASNQSLNFNGGYEMKLKKLDLRTGINTDIGYNQNTNYVNGALNDTHSGNYGLNLNLSKYKEKQYSFYLNAGATYNTSVSSIQSATSVKYWSYTVEGDFNKTLPGKFNVDVSPQMNFYQKTSAFANKNIALVNANISKNFMKNDALELKASVNDLFNQNTGFTRSISTNESTQSAYTAIHRYFMFTVTWNFSKNGKPTNGF